MLAKMGMASGPEISTRAASAAQASRKEAATMATPNASRPSGTEGCTPLRRRDRAGAGSTAHSPIGRASFEDTRILRNGRAARNREDQGVPGQTAQLAEGLAHPGLGP